MRLFWSAIVVWRRARRSGRGFHEQIDYEQEQSRRRARGES
jgi:hypothetical protein